jgi:hypothetical protein
VSWRRQRETTRGDPHQIDVQLGHDTRPGPLDGGRWPDPFDAGFTMTAL